MRSYYAVIKKKAFEIAEAKIKHEMELNIDFDPNEPDPVNFDSTIGIPAEPSDAPKHKPKEAINRNRRKKSKYV